MNKPAKVHKTTVRLIIEKFSELFENDLKSIKADIIFIYLQNQFPLKESFISDLVEQSVSDFMETLGLLNEAGTEITHKADILFYITRTSSVSETENEFIFEPYTDCDKLVFPHKDIYLELHGKNNTNKLNKLVQEKYTRLLEMFYSDFEQKIKTLQEKRIDNLYERFGVKTLSKKYTESLLK